MQTRQIQVTTFPELDPNDAVASFTIQSGVRRFWSPHDMSVIEAKFKGKKKAPLKFWQRFSRILFCFTYWCERGRPVVTRRSRTCCGAANNRFRAWVEHLRLKFASLRMKEMFRPHSLHISN